MSDKQVIYRKDYTPSPFLIKNIYLNVILDEDVTRVISTVTFHPNPDSLPTDAVLELMGEELDLISVKLNEKPFENYEKTDESLILNNIPIDKQFKVEVVTECKPQNNKSLEGLYKSSGNYCTQCEAQGFRKITYYLDRPDVMASFTTRIEANIQNYPILLSNGNRIEEGKLNKTRHFAIWNDPFKKPCYLFALVAGDLDFNESTFKTMSGREVVIRIFVEKGNVSKTEHAMNAVKKSMAWDEEHYGREYDLDIFMIVAVSDFNMGAMENKGLNIFNDKYILANPETATDIDYENIDVVVSHEYFHNWTGNRVTCREWFNLCLKEGLTVFRDQSFTEDVTNKSLARIKQVQTLRMRQFPEDSSGLAHSVRPDSYIEINNFYTATVYEKGAEIFRMLKLLLGPAGFRKGTDLYFDRFDGRAVTIDDIMDVMAEANNVDLTQFRLWYGQAGTPVVSVRAQYDESSSTYTLTFNQSVPDTPEQTNKKPMLIPMTLSLLDDSGKLLKKQQTYKLNEKESIVDIKHINSMPTPSLLQHFSAPVKLEYDYSDEDLYRLMKHDHDDFNHWEAGQRIATNTILKLVKALKAKEALTLDTSFIEAFRHCLMDESKNPGLLALSLTLPSEHYVGSFMETFEVQAISDVRKFVIKTLAMELRKDWQKTYDNNQSLSSYQFNNDDVVRRALKNTALYYLAQAGDDDLALNQYKDSDNMTDSIAALKALNDIESQTRTDIFDAYYKSWKNDHLVLNKWFNLQAVSRRGAAFDDIKALSEHPDFDVKNPNKVYALLYSFAVMNPTHFHRADGAAYEFYANKIIEIDGFNPQVASRLAREFSSWKRVGPDLQALANNAMKKILDSASLSKDVYEIITKIQ